MQNLKATTSEVVHLKTLWAVHYKPLQEVHSIRYSHMKDGRVFYSEEKGDCGDRLIAVNFSSPRWTWEKLCGRSGLLYICPVCKRQVKFDCRIMN